MQNQRRHPPETLLGKRNVMVVILVDLIDHREHIVRVLATQVTLDDHEEKVRCKIFEMLFDFTFASLLGLGEVRCEDWRKA